MNQTLNVTFAEYNEQAVVQGWPTVDDEFYFEWQYVNCTIVGFFNETYGKWPLDGETASVVMEYQYLLQHLSKFLIPPAPPEFNSWTEANP